MGIIYCKEGQQEESQMFSNGELPRTSTNFQSEASSTQFEDFLKLLANDVELKGFSGYAGGLDTKGKSSLLVSLNPSRQYHRNQELLHKIFGHRGFCLVSLI